MVRMDNVKNYSFTGRVGITTAPIGRGNSGGGLFVFRDGHYHLVGIISMRFDHLSAAAMFSTLKEQP